jgi:hypothetical protein
MADGNSVATVSNAYSTSEILNRSDEDPESLSSIPTSTTETTSPDDSQELHNTIRSPDDPVDHSSTSEKSSMTVEERSEISYTYSASPEGDLSTNSNDRGTTTANLFSSTTTHQKPGITLSTTSLSDASSIIANEPHPSPANQPPQFSVEPASSITSDTPSIPSLRPSSPPSAPGTTTTISSFSQSLVHSPHAASSGGESIYRTIMNRLTVLESNTTLYTRYVEEQTAGVREVLRRLGEDVGRLEGIVSITPSHAESSLTQLTIINLEQGTSSDASAIFSGIGKVQAATRVGTWRTNVSSKLPCRRSTFIPSVFICLR